MKIIITGALGHIGSKVARLLPAFFPKSKIILVDDFTTQRYPSLFNLPEQGTYTFIEGDILKMDLKALFSGANAVIHLAAITDATQSFGNREQVEHVNYDFAPRSRSLHDSRRKNISNFINQRLWNAKEPG